MATTSKRAGLKSPRNERQLSNALAHGIYANLWMPAGDLAFPVTSCRGNDSDALFRKIAMATGAFARVMEWKNCQATTTTKKTNQVFPTTWDLRGGARIHGSRSQTDEKQQTTVWKTERTEIQWQFHNDQKTALQAKSVGSVFDYYEVTIVLTCPPLQSAFCFTPLPFISLTARRSSITGWMFLIALMINSTRIILPKLLLENTHHQRKWQKTRSPEKTSKQISLFTPTSLTILKKGVLHRDKDDQNYCKPNSRFFWRCQHFDTSKAEILLSF